MPELPEVESVKRSMSRQLPKGAKWVEVLTRRKDLRVPFPKDLKDQLIGTEVLGLERRGKYLVFKREDLDLLSHLGMSGSWRKLETNEPLKTHDHLIFGFDNGLRLAYNDPRRFGLVDWGGEDCRWLKDLGPEPLSKSFNLESFLNSIKDKKVAIKILLMNPKVVVGVGNIYASEILFLSGVRPTRESGRLTKAEAGRVVENTKLVLQKAIKSKGSTLRDYKMVNGQSGSFQNSFNVYGREGQLCKICGSQIKALVLGQRSTFWCSRCQK